jgi:Flp pilus assembly protein TadB
MRKYQMTALFAVCAVVFTTIATLIANRVIIAILFLMLLGFIAVADRTIRRLHDREKELTNRLDELTRQLQTQEEGSTELEAQHTGETP